MNLNNNHIKLITLTILCSIIIGQVILVHNLYNAQQRLALQIKDEALRTAILSEYTHRHEKMGGTIAYSPVADPSDTSRFITKEIKLIDTTFKVTYDRNDPYNRTKLAQFILKDHLPLNVNMANQIYKEELSLRGLSKVETYIEYIDLKNNKVLQHSNIIGNSENYTASQLQIIDIFDTIGVKGFIQIPISSTIKAMAYQLILTGLLIAVCSYFLSIIVKTFSWREKMEQMRQDAVNSMTHEFKRPISSALAQVSLIPYYLGRDNIQRAHQYADNTVLELKKLTSYIERVQKLSNDQLGSIALDRGAIQLSAFFTTVLEKYQHEKEKPTSIDLHLSTRREYLEADLVHFSNIIDNLIENAIKYSADQVAIHITVSDEEDKLKISVKDNGLGIADNELPFIFKKFYRSENKNIQRKVGFGLGLTYVKALVEAHAGEIKVNSTLGKGSEFMLYLP